VVTHYYDSSDPERIEKAETLHELVGIAVDVLRRMPPQICTVVGPFTSGTRTLEENGERIRQMIAWLKKKHVPTFNYLPLRKRAVMILLGGRDGGSLSHDEERELQGKLFDGLYAPILRSGLIRELRLMPGSDASVNARRMRQYAQAGSIALRLIPEEAVPNTQGVFYG